MEFKKHAQKFTTPNLIIYREPSELPLLSVVVSKKVHTKAVGRNKIKRALKQTLLDYARDTTIVLVKPRAQSTSQTPLLKRELKEVLSKNV